jgi:DHA2 family multidrug resistance protein
VIASVSLIAFVVREVTATAPIVNLRVLANQNLATGTFLIGLLGIIIYGTTAILPLFLQDLIGYTPYLSGLAVAPRGIGALASMLLAGRLAGRFDERLLITIGVVIRSVSLLLLGDLNVTMSMGSVVWPNIINGFANGFLFVLLTTITMETLPREMIGMGTGLYNLFRNMGASFGISMVTTFLTRGAQAHQDMLVQHFNPSNLRYLSAVQRLSSILSVQDGMAGHQQALAWIYRSMVQQALLCSYIDDFRLLGFLSFLCIPFLVLFRNADKRGSPRARAIESD